MAKFMVVGTARSGCFKIEVEAPDEECAISEVKSMIARSARLASRSDLAIEVDYVEVSGPMPNCGG